MAKALRYVLAPARTVAGGRGDRGRRDRRVGGAAQEGAAGVPDLRPEVRVP